MTFTWTVWLSTSPKPLDAAQLKVPEAFLLIFFIVSTFPSCSTPVFPWFPVFSLVQVTFGSGLPNASHVNCKLLPSWTVCSPLISVISAGTKSRKSHWKKIEYTSKTILNCIMWKVSGEKIYTTAHLDLPKIVLMRRYGIATLINFCFLRIKLSELNFVWQTVLRLTVGGDTFLSWFRFSFFLTPCVVYIVLHLVIWQKKKNRKASFLARVCSVIEFVASFSTSCGTECK